MATVVCCAIFHILNHKVHGNIRQPDALVHFFASCSNWPNVRLMILYLFSDSVICHPKYQKCIYIHTRTHPYQPNTDFPFAALTTRSVWKWLSTYLAIPLTCCRLLTLKIVHYNDELAPIFFKENRAGTLLTILPLAVTLVLYRVQWYRRQPAC